MKIVKRVVGYGLAAIALAMVLLVIITAIYSVALEARWSDCKVELTDSFVYASEHNGIKITYQEKTVKVLNYDQDSIFNELSGGSPTSFQKETASSDIMELHFGDGSYLQISRLGEDRVQLYYKRENHTYGFCLSDVTSFKNILAYFNRNL
jgi:hypothetical protein